MQEENFKDKEIRKEKYYWKIRENLENDQYLIIRIRIKISLIMIKKNCISLLAGYPYKGYT